MTAVKVESAPLWLFFPEAENLPDDVTHEIGASALLDAGGDAAIPTRGASDSIAVLVDFAVSGVVGNAAWAVFPLTAAYVRGLHRARKEARVLDAQDAAAVARMAADEIVGAGLPMKVHSVLQLADGRWELELDVNGDRVLAHIAAKGTVVAWRTVGRVPPAA